MKNRIRIVTLLLFSFLLVGCASDNKEEETVEKYIEAAVDFGEYGLQLEDELTIYSELVYEGELEQSVNHLENNILTLLDEMDDFVEDMETGDIELLENISKEQFDIIDANRTIYETILDAVVEIPESLEEESLFNMENYITKIDDEVKLIIEKNKKVTDYKYDLQEAFPQVELNEDELDEQEEVLDRYEMLGIYEEMILFPVNVFMEMNYIPVDVFYLLDSSSYY